MNGNCISLTDVMTLDNELDQAIFNNMSLADQHRYRIWRNKETERRIIVTESETYVRNLVLDIITNKPTSEPDKKIRKDLMKYINKRLEHEKYSKDFTRKAKIVQYILYDAVRINLVDIALRHLDLKYELTYGSHNI